MTRIIGTYDQSALALMAALTIASRSSHTRRSTPVTKEQAAAADKRTERQRWNDEVEARKAQKRNGKAMP